MINKNSNGIFIAVFVNNGSLFNIFFIKNAAIKNPIKTFVGAGAIAMDSGISTISQ